MRDSNTAGIRKKNINRDSAVFDIVEFGSSSRVSVLYNIVHSDNTGYFSLVDRTPKTGNEKKKGKFSKNRVK